MDGFDLTKFQEEGEEIEMKQGVIIFIGADAVYGFRAEENTTFILRLY